MYGATTAAPSHGLGERETLAKDKARLCQPEVICSSPAEMGAGADFGRRHLQPLIRRISRKKDLHFTEASKLNRCLGVLDLTLLSLGAMLGVGIYVLAGHVVKAVTGPAIILSFIFAGFASALSGLCYAEMAGRVPKAGSAYVYSYVSTGEGMALVIGWNLILEYAIGAASVAKALSGYLDYLVNKAISIKFAETMPIHLAHLSSYFDPIAFATPICISVLLSIGLKASARLNNILASINLALLSFVILLGLTKMDPGNWHLPLQNSTDSLPEGPRVADDADEDLMKNGVPPGFGEGGFMPYGFSGVMAGAATCFYAFVGFDAVACSGEEALNPRRNIPVAILVSLVLACLGYVGLSSALTLMMPYYLQDEAAPLPAAFQYARIGWAGYIVNTGAIIALFTCMFGSLFPLPRIIFAMSSDGLLFRSLASVSEKTQAPIVATIVGGTFVGLIASILDLSSLVDMMSIGTLMAYTMVAVAVLIVRYRNKDNNSNSGGKEYQELVSEAPQDFGDDARQSDPSEDIEEQMALNPGQAGTSIKHQPWTSSLPTETERLNMSSSSFFRQLLNLDRVPELTPETALVSHILIGVLVVLSFIMSSLLASWQPWSHPSSTVEVLVGLVGCLLAFGIVSLYLQPLPPHEASSTYEGDRMETESTGFKVPLFPLVPVISIMLNIYLMMKLSYATWTRFSVWMAAGFLIYMGYGWWNSSLEYRDKGMVPPGEKTGSARKI